MLPKRNTIDAVMRQNNLVTYAYSQLLNLSPRFLTREMVDGLAWDCNITPDEAFLFLFAAACGFDTVDNPEHRSIELDYIRTGVQRLDPTVYQNDPYYRTVRFPQKRMGKWEMKTETYAPYEPFVCNHPKLTADFREIPQIGYFDQEFPFPAILENGVEWMTVTPNEIETMRQPIQNSHGRVLTLGLGLGYFAFCASAREEVESITVVEREEDVIQLFTRELLPQFPHKDKIRILQADAFDVMREPDTGIRYDYIFADLWHDQSDGLALYLKLRRLEKEQRIQNMDYWIEPTLLSTLRHMVYEKLSDPTFASALRDTSAEELLSDDFLKRLAPDLKRID